MIPSYNDDVVHNIKALSSTSPYSLLCLSFLLHFDMHAPKQDSYQKEEFWEESVVFMLSRIFKSLVPFFFHRKRFGGLNGRREKRKKKRMSTLNHAQSNVTLEENITCTQIQQYIPSSHVYLFIFKLQICNILHYYLYWMKICVYM